MCWLFKLCVWFGTKMSLRLSCQPLQFGKMTGSSGLWPHWWPHSLVALLRGHGKEMGSSWRKWVSLVSDPLSLFDGHHGLGSSTHDPVMMLSLGVTETRVRVCMCMCLYYICTGRSWRLILGIILDIGEYPILILGMIILLSFSLRQGLSNPEPAHISAVGSQLALATLCLSLPRLDLQQTPHLSVILWEPELHSIPLAHIL